VSRTFIAAGLAALLLAGCLPTAAPPTAAPSATTTAASPAAAAQSAPAPTASAPTAPSAPSASPSAAAELLPIAGVWRVRKALAPGDRSGLIDDPAFDEETYAIRPGCDREPCDRVEVTTTPLGLTGPATVIAMQRAGATYTSAAQPTQASSCVSTLGDRVDGGAETASTLRIWVATDRPPGSAVASTVLRGVVELDIRPTSIGASAGCEPTAATFDLTGRREQVAVRNPDGTFAGPDLQPPLGAALVRLPSLSPKVSGATVEFFGITGDTSRELAASVGRGGVKACGLIDYEWFRGDARPSACTLTRVSDTRSSIRTATSASGACRVTKATIRASYTIHMPRWTDPDRVPKRLLDWWRRIVDLIATHEGGHVRIGRDYIRRLNARLVGKPCEDVNSIIRSWVRQHATAQEAFDRSEYAKPWPEPARGY
jgi:predicted secreted Zn-dependent protease